MLEDTLTGALTLSVIDFFMSLFFISFIGLVLKLFPLLGGASKPFGKGAR